MYVPNVISEEDYGSPRGTPSSRRQPQTPRSRESKKSKNTFSANCTPTTISNNNNNLKQTAETPPLQGNPFKKLIEPVVSDFYRHSTDTSSNNNKDSQRSPSKASDNTQEVGMEAPADTTENVQAAVKKIEDMSMPEGVLSNAVWEGFASKSIRYSGPVNTGPQSRDPAARDRDSIILPTPALPTSAHKGSALDRTREILEGGPYSPGRVSKGSSPHTNFSNDIYSQETPCPSPRKPHPGPSDAQVSPQKSRPGPSKTQGSPIKFSMEAKQERLLSTPTPTGSPSTRGSPAPRHLEFSSIMKSRSKSGAEFRKLEEVAGSQPRIRKRSEPTTENRRTNVVRTQEPKHFKSSPDLVAANKHQTTMRATKSAPTNLPPAPTVRKETSVFALPRPKDVMDYVAGYSPSRGRYRVLTNLGELEEQLDAYREKHAEAAASPSSSPSKYKPTSSTNSPQKAAPIQPSASDDNDITSLLERNRGVLYQLEEQHAGQRFLQRSEAAQLASDLRSYYMISEEDIPENDKVIYPENSDAKHAEALRRIEEKNSWTGMMEEQNAMRYELLRMQAYFLLEKEQHRQSKERILKLEYKLLQKEHAKLTAEKSKLLEKVGEK